MKDMNSVYEKLVQAKGVLVNNRIGKRRVDVALLDLHVARQGVMAHVGGRGQKKK